MADPHAVPTKLHLIAYGPDEFVERDIDDLRGLDELRARYRVLWLDVAGLADVETLRVVGTHFGLHRLELEDVVNVHQRPKVERYPGHQFVVARMVNPGAGCETEQLALVFGANFVLTFQEFPGDGFGPVRERLRLTTGVLRNSGPDYLAYALLDATVDQYFVPLEALGERLEALESEVCDRPRATALQDLHTVKRELLALRRAVWPLREALNHFRREDTGLIHVDTRPYLDDLYDHTVQIMDVIETHREVASGLLDIYLSSMSHRLNEVMRVLTVIATIFIPLTFLSSIWGMNFDHMPELKTEWGYPVALLSFLVIGLSFFWFFKRRGWIGTGASSRDLPAEPPDGNGPEPRA